MGYLWQRGSSWTFQFHVPKGFVDRLGRTPIRVPLGRLHALEARRRARILAGRATEMLGAGVDDRDIMRRSLAALAAELAALSKAEFSAGVMALPGPALDDPEPEIRTLDERRRTAAAERRDSLRAMRQRLDGIGVALSLDGAAWEAERATHARIVAQLATVPSFRPALDAEPAPVMSVPSLPVLSSTIDGYLQRKAADGVSLRHADGLPRRFLAFIEHVGDKRVDEYRASDLQSFTSTLARVPATWSKDARIKDLSAHAASEWNGARKVPLSCMSETTVRLGYARPIRTWLSWLALEHRFLDPFSGMRLTVPKSARGSVRRKPLTVDELNRWFAHAARQDRADDRFLPLLGFLTGARIAELVFAQGRDLQQVSDGIWALSLAEPLLVDGRETRRPLKNANSARLIALHQSLSDVGFIAWAQRRPAAGWLFPHLHAASIVRPSDTASKRMARSMQNAGVHEPLVKVFHSLRHSAKDWLLREARLPDHVVRRQMGHAAEDVAETYGDDPLTPAEVREIAAAPLPEGLDIRPYLRGRIVTA